MLPDGSGAPRSRQSTAAGAGSCCHAVIGRATGRSGAGAPALSASRSPASSARMTAPRSSGVNAVNSIIAPSLSRTSCLPFFRQCARDVCPIRACRGRAQRHNASETSKRPREPHSREVSPVVTVRPQRDRSRVAGHRLHREPGGSRCADHGVASAPESLEPEHLDHGQRVDWPFDHVQPRRRNRRGARPVPDRSSASRRHSVACEVRVRWGPLRTRPIRIRPD